MQDCRLHHIGYTVADIKTTVEQFSHLGYQAGPILFDEALQVELCYLTPEGHIGADASQRREGHHTIELIHQLNDASLEAEILRAHGVMPYHLAYEADDFDRTCAALDTLGYVRLFDPVPVKALGGIRICYFHHPAVGYIEILSNN